MREAVSVREHPRAKANRYGQGRRPEVKRFARIKADPVSAHRLHRPDSSPLHQLSDRARPSRQQDLQIPDAWGGEIKCNEEHITLRRRTNSSLFGRPVKSVPTCEIDGVFRICRTCLSCGANRRTERAGGCASKQAAARDLVVRAFAQGVFLSHHWTVATFSAILDSGS